MSDITAYSVNSHKIIDFKKETQILQSTIVSVIYL